jgi:signal transduction histidine kinase
MSFDSILRAYFVIGAMEIGAAFAAGIMVTLIPGLSPDETRLLLLDVGAILLTGLACFIPILFPAPLVRHTAAMFLGIGAPLQPLFVTAALVLAGEAGALIAVLYPMSLTFAFYLLRPPIAVLSAVAAIVQYGLVLGLQPGHSNPLLKWLIISTAVLGTSAAVGWIAGRSDRLRDEANAARGELATLNRELEQRVADQVSEVRASRARIVAAADESRRRIERNIHDGAQQQLVAISLDLRILAEGVDRLPADKIRSQLDQAHGNLKDALDDLRELARGLHPPVLTTDGLGPALDQLVARASLPVMLTAPSERFPTSIETAVYFVVAEALANASKHASATQVRVDVVRADDALVITVADDGQGGASVIAGGGLAGLADRVAARDGSLQVDSLAGSGTTITVSLPVDGAKDLRDSPDQDT